MNTRTHDAPLSLLIALVLVLASSPGCDAEVSTAPAPHFEFSELNDNVSDTDDAAPTAPAAASPALVSYDIGAVPFIVDQQRLDTVIAWHPAQPKSGAAEVTGEDTGDVVLIGAQTPSEDVNELALYRADGSRTQRLWRAGAIKAGPMTLFATHSGTGSGARDGAGAALLWSQAAYPGRALMVLEIQGDVIGSPKEIETPDDFDPIGAPLVAAHPDGGAMICSNAQSGSPRCARWSPGGTATPQWRKISPLKSAPIWRLVASPKGFFVFGTRCKRGGCHRPRIVMQRLNAKGQTRGPMRILTRLTGSRPYGVIPVDGGALLFGRRSLGQDAAAWLVTRNGFERQHGKWNRVIGGVTTYDGALTVEVGVPEMRDGKPVGHRRPRTWTLDGKRHPARAWPERAQRWLPLALDQIFVAAAGVIALGEAGSIDDARPSVQGVALLPKPLEIGPR